MNVRFAPKAGIGFEIITRCPWRGFPFIFPGDKARKPLYDLAGAWKTICASAKLENLPMHDLRHTFASHLVSGGQSLTIVGKLIGHTQAATKRYTHLANAPLRKATDQFGGIFDGIGKLAPPAKTRAA